jgi:hypothetical protein
MNVRFGQSDADREAIYRLRYDVYVEMKLGWRRYAPTCADPIAGLLVPLVHIRMLTVGRRTAAVRQLPGTRGGVSWRASRESD